MELRIPKLRKGWYSPRFLEPRRMAEKALTAAMGGMGVSQVSRPCEEIDARIKAFLGRPPEGDCPGVQCRRVAAAYVKVRRNHRIVSVAVTIAVGDNGHGRREMPGMDTGPSRGRDFLE